MRHCSVVRAAFVSFCVSCLMPSLAFAETTETAPMGYGALLFQLVLVVIGVCALAYVILRFGLKRLIAPEGKGGPMEVVSRLPLEPRRSILLVRVGERHLIVGSSEAGLSTLGELDEWEPEATESSPSKFATLLRRTTADGETLEESETKEAS